MKTLEDTSTFAGNTGQQANQVMGSSAGYDEYLHLYALAEDKCQFNADWMAGKFSEKHLTK